MSLQHLKLPKFLLGFSLVSILSGAQAMTKEEIKTAIDGKWVVTECTSSSPAARELYINTDFDYKSRPFNGVYDPIMRPTYEVFITGWRPNAYPFVHVYSDSSIVFIPKVDGRKYTDRFKDDVFLGLKRVVHQRSVFLKDGILVTASLKEREAFVYRHNVWGQIKVIALPDGKIRFFHNSSFESRKLGNLRADSGFCDYERR